MAPAAGAKEVLGRGAVVATKTPPPRGMVWYTMLWYTMLWYTMRYTMRYTRIYKQTPGSRA